MEAANPIWPEKEDYDDAMKEMAQRVRDPVIRRGRLERDRAGIVRFGGANHYITLYKVDNWMVRCFCQDEARGKKPPSDIKTRYEHISRFCSKYAGDGSVLVHIEYVPEAIQVDLVDRRNDSYVLLKTEVLPFVRMEFISGLSLHTFIAKHYYDRQKMEALCDAWLRMIRELETIHMAHGDLDLTNIIVQEQGGNIRLKLVDYDNAWIPTFAHLRPRPEQTELGHEHFQHPAFRSKSSRPFDEYMDRFSALTIYISLKTLAVYPDLYKQREWGAGDSHLLLTKADYEAEMQSSPNHITQLQKASIPGMALLLNELSRSIQERHHPCSLTELVSSNVRNVPPGKQDGFMSSKRTQPARDNNESETVYNAWDQVSYIKQPGEPLVAPPQPERLILPQAPQTNWGQPQQTTWTQPANAAPPTQQTSWQPTESNNTPSQRTTKSVVPAVVSLIVLIIVIVLIVVAILWFTDVIPHLPASGSPSWILPPTTWALL